MILSVHREKNKRQTMEDHFDTVQMSRPFPALLAGVFDGHGGERCSSLLSSSFLMFLFPFVEPYLRELRKTDNPFSVPLVELTETIQRSFQSFDKKYIGTCTSGSTACILIHLPVPTKGAWLIVANVGDSRFFLVDKKTGQIVFVTRDHKPDDPEEKKRIYLSGSTIIMDGPIGRVNGDLALSRAFGDSRHKPTICSFPDVSIRWLPNGSKMKGYLFSDGLTEALSNELIYEYENKHGATALIKKLLATSFCIDNLTLLVFEF